MPSKTVSPAILDTSVYIENFRNGRFTQQILASPFLFRDSSVVIHELLRGAQAAAEQAFARDLAANLRLTLRDPHETCQKGGRSVVELSKQRDLLPLCGGSRGLTSEVVSGKRAVSKARAKKLAEFFHVSVEVFI